MSNVELSTSYRKFGKYRGKFRHHVYILSYKLTYNTIITDIRIQIFFRIDKKFVKKSNKKRKTVHDMISFLDCTNAQ